MKRIPRCHCYRELCSRLFGAVVASAQKTGGYREIDKADEGAVAAAEFAVKDQSEKKELTYKLVSVEKPRRRPSPELTIAFA